MRLLIAGAVVIMGASCAAKPEAAREELAPAEPSVPVADLVGSEWIAERIDGRGILDGVRSTLRFEAADRVSGDTACNRFNGPLAASADGVRIGPLATTRRACPPLVMAQEQTYVQALERTRRLLGGGATLELVDETGETVVRMARRPSAG